MVDPMERLRLAVADRYAIERELGAGGMATVYLAEDRRHHRRIALKTLRAELAASMEAQRFLVEIEIAAALTHPHILPLYDSGEADGIVYYVMPYVEGPSLRERLVGEQVLPLSEALKIAREVVGAQGLERDIPVVLEVLREIDRGHAAGAELALDAVAVREGRGEAGRDVGHRAQDAVPGAAWLDSLVAFPCRTPNRRPS